MKQTHVLKSDGFTLVELLVAMAIALVVLAAVFSTFRTQQDTFVVQTQLSSTQQNIRAAMYMMTRDIQMAGYYTNFVTNTYTLDWDNLDNDNNPTTGTESIRPLLYAQNDVNDSGGGDGIRDGTDVIVIVKAGDEGRKLVAGEEATAGDSTTASLTLTSRDLDGVAGDDLNNSGKKYGLLIKEDLRRAELFEINAADSYIFPAGLQEYYTKDDWVFRADIIIYRVDNDAAHPSLERRNLGNDNGYQTIAEDIDNLQFQYLLKDNTWTNDPNANAGNVRAVGVYMIARTANVNKGFTDNNTYTLGATGATFNYAPPAAERGYRRKLLSKTIKTRNIGL